MKKTLTYKILEAHLVSGEMTPGEGIAIRIDNTLTQDSTGTLAYLQYEAISDDKVKTKRSVAYIDHNMLQTDFKNMDDHKYIQTVTDKIGVIYSRPGNGICHRLNLERFSMPGETLLGSDSHTPTCGGVGMIAIGAGGLDVAAAMAGSEYYLTMPKVVGVKLTGKLSKGVSAKDIILEVLRILDVKGGVGKVIEYYGEGVSTLSVSERGTICNMGAELGATTSVFPTDDRTLKFFKAQKREDDFKLLSADEGCTYDENIEINLDELKPLVACPHSPGNVKTVEELEGMEVTQIAVGSCTNSSYEDLVTMAKILKGKIISPNVSLTISPGSRQVLDMISKNGALSDLLNAGARLLECSCAACIGQGAAPGSNGVSLRTFNRNFKGRCGTPSAGVYLISPETAAVSAITGKLTSPYGKVDFEVEEPEEYIVNDNMFIKPEPDKSKVSVKGPNIKPFPKASVIPDEFSIKVVTKLGDNISTDDIMPSNAALLSFRSNIPYLSDFCLKPVDENFAAKAKAEENGSIIVGADNYGQGSSREHAALAPLYLGVKAVIVKSFARIHKNNLINNGIVPLTFANEADYDTVDEGDIISAAGMLAQLDGNTVTVKNETKNLEYKLNLEVSDRERLLLKNGGLINYLKTRN